ncbi:MAG: family 43 glycosylhydrolase, partial [Ruthenibacterium sp.]
PVYVPMKSIDPSLFFENNRCYFMTPQTKHAGETRGIYMAEIDCLTGALRSEERLLWQGSGGKCLEAPHLYHINAWYYLFAAEGGTEYGHCVTVARSRTLWGPYESCAQNPMITNRDDHDNPLQCAGHGDLVKAPDGSWAMVLLASRWSTKWHSQIGRETCLVPIVWKDEWPCLARGDHHLHAAVSLPWRHEPQHLPHDFHADFTTPDWDLSLNFLRNPDFSRYRRNRADNSVTLRGAAPLSEIGSPTFIGHRQQWMSCT